MTRQQKVEIVEEFLSCMAEGDIEGLPISTTFHVETPLLPRCGGEPAKEYMRATAAATQRIRIQEHIVEDNRVATLSENLTPKGPLQVFARFVIEGERISEARVFYDPRVILGSPAA